MYFLGDQNVHNLLEALHAKSEKQVELIRAFNSERDKLERPPSLDEIKAFRSEKFVVLDRDKAEFCYLLCRAKKVSKVVEVGTSYGVSGIVVAEPARDKICSLVSYV